jgi:hypothetical protein
LEEKKRSETVHAPKSGFLLFFPRAEHKVFHIENPHKGRINHRLHPDIFVETSLKIHIRVE